jgi:hypothetical protein
MYVTRRYTKYEDLNPDARADTEMKCDILKYYIDIFRILHLKCCISTMLASLGMRGIKGMGLCNIQ